MAWISQPELPMHKTSQLLFILSALLFSSSVSLASSSYDLRSEFSTLWQSDRETHGLDNSKYAVLLINQFLSNLTIEDLYWMHRIEREYTQDLINSLEFTEILKKPLSTQTTTLLARSHIFERNENRVTPQEFEHLLVVWQEWPITVTSDGRILNHQIFEAASKLYQRVTANSKFGEIYEVTFHGRVPLFFQARAIYLSPQDQKLINDTLASTQSNQVLSNDWIHSRIKNNSLSLEEARELKGLSLASAQFENLTFIKGDRGGWRGNFLGAFEKTPEQTLCHEKSLTSAFFLKTLQNRGLMKYFDSQGTILRFNHEAALLQNKRTKEYFVFDTWFENGGTPARIYDDSDWSNHRNKNYFIPAISKQKEGS